MIDELRITSLGVIDATVLELGPGLTVVTGETGAGKTMVVTALGLLLGARADSGLVRAGAGRARVEGVVRADATPDLSERVDAVGGEIDDGVVVLARQVTAEGRSRAFVGGAGVPAGTLAEVAEPLVAVHGQSDQHRLLRPAAQRAALDRHAGVAVSGPLARWTELRSALVAVDDELAALVTSARQRAQEADLLRFGLAEVEAVDPQPGEDAELAAEESRLGYADTLRTAAEQAREVLSSDSGQPDALAAVAAARSLLDSVRDHDPAAAELAGRLAEVSYLLSDVAADVASYASGLETDPLRLAAVSERRAALTALQRKYGDSVDDVLAWAERAAARLTGLDGSDERIETLTAERRRLRRDLAETGAALTAVRTRAAARLEAAVTGELAGLAMPHARLAVRVSQDEAGDAGEDPDAPGVLEVGDRRLRHHPWGLDEVEILLAANPGAEPRPLARAASGGELSRLMLGLEVTLADTASTPTFVFDEVDAGVGGRAAVEVGRRLARLARSAQVVVVTHLPQVAAYADRHVLVAKASDGSVTSTGLTVLDDAARVRELSRMLAGQEESAAARAHAEELLSTARGESGPDLG